MWTVAKRTFGNLLVILIASATEREDGMRILRDLTEHLLSMSHPSRDIRFLNKRPTTALILVPPINRNSAKPEISKYTSVPD